ncbi:MAG: porin [Thalassobaculum sp.]|uniref:porin n=1 Tax=Thalassobaculum sp. TaxID=2022740 RepID=UPI0032F07288
MRSYRRAVIGALLAGTAASPALAADKLQIELGGEFTQYFGYAKNDKVAGGDFSGLDVKSDGAVTFGGDFTLDIGLQVGVEVNLKSETADGEQIDGSYLWLEHGFGRLEVGSRDSAAALMHYSAPDVGLGVNDSDIADWIVNPSTADGDSAFQSTYLYLGEDQATKITYFTPRFEGFQIGVSYIPEFERDNNDQPSGDLYRNGVALGVNYVRTLGEVEVALAAGYLRAEKPDGSTGIDDAQGYSFGGNVGYAGFTFGASFSDTKGNGSAGTDSAVSFDGRGYDVGVAYAFDAFQVSLSYYNGKVADSAAAGDSKHETVMLSGNYEVGPGVNLLASVFRSEFEADTGTTNDGWAAITGLTVTF